MSEKRIKALKVYQEKVRTGEVERSATKSIKEKWEEKKTSTRASINYMCFQCMGGDMGDNVKKEIKDCSSKDCALYLVRPYK